MGPLNPAHKAHVRFLAIIAVASVVAVLATPHGLSLYLYPFQTQGSVAQQKLIVEWSLPTSTRSTSGRSRRWCSS